MRTISRLLLLVLILLFLSVGTSHAQWTNVAPNLLRATDTVGAMQFRDGIVWAGGSTLWSSLDSGKTWLQCKAFPSAHISDIAFYDRQHGMVATLDKGFFITVDGGNGWFQKYAANNFVKVSYDGSDSILLALTIDGLFFYSSDGGMVWKNSFPIGNGFSNSFALAGDGTIYIDAGNQNFTGLAEVSTDRGQTWNTPGGPQNGDSWSIAIDSCNTERIYLANEEWQTTDSSSNFYLSTDGGQTWQVTDSHTKPYLSGSMCTTTDGIFLGTRDGSGVHRSMDRGLTWKAIGGPSLAPDTRNIATITDNIILATDTAGNIWRTTNGGGDSVQSEPSGTLKLMPTQLFSADTLECDSVVRGVQIIRGCPSAPFLIAAVLAGPDSASYQIDSIGSDSITLTLFPQKTGTQNAWLLGQLDNGTNDTVFLSGFVAQTSGTFSIAPLSLFMSDTLHCDSITSSVHLTSSGCRPPVPTQITISGPDANSFHIVDSTGDSISVIWTAQTAGAQNAWLLFPLNNGTTDSVALGGFSTSTPFEFFYTPQSLFSADSLFIACDPATPAQIWIYDTACIWPSITSEQIVGADSADYVIHDSMTSPVVASDSTLILFQPKDTGVRAAMYQLTLSNGTIISIPLSGVGLAKHILTLSASSMNEKTDTVGGTVNVPITINGLARPENVELVLNYPLPDLEYVGSFDPTGTEVDVPGEAWSGRSLLRIMNAQPNAVAAYTRFNVFSDTDYDPAVTFDSLDVLTAIAPCEYSIPPAITDTIVPLEGCEIQMLSEWLHLGELPLFSIIPNPTNGAVELNSSLDLGDAQVEVYDVLGAERGEFPVTLHQNVPIALTLPFENGLYFLRIVSAEGEAHLTVIIHK